jgi:hypothetical protein
MRMKYDRNVPELSQRLKTVYQGIPRRQWGRSSLMLAILIVEFKELEITQISRFCTRQEQLHSLRFDFFGCVTRIILDQIIQRTEVTEDR